MKFNRLWWTNQNHDEILVRVIKYSEDAGKTMTQTIDEFVYEQRIVKLSWRKSHYISRRNAKLRLKFQLGIAFFISSKKFSSDQNYRNERVHQGRGTDKKSILITKNQILAPVCVGYTSILKGNSNINSFRNSI